MLVRVLGSECVLALRPRCVGLRREQTRGKTARRTTTMVTVVRVAMVMARRRQKGDVKLLGSAEAKRKRHATTMIKGVESSLATPMVILRSIAYAMELLGWSATCAGRGGEQQGGRCCETHEELDRKITVELGVQPGPSFNCTIQPKAELTIQPNTTCIFGPCTLLAYVFYYLYICGPCTFGSHTDIY